MGACNRNRSSVILLVIALVVVIGVIRAQADSGAPDGASVRHRVVSIEIRGNDVVSDAEILEAMKVEVGDYLSENEAKKRVSAALEIGKLSNAVSKLEPTAGGRKLVFAVEEYPRVEGYRFSGNTVFSSEELQEIVSLGAQEVLDTNVLNKDLAAILEEYEKRGYAVGLSGVSLSSDGFVLVKLLEHRIGDIIIEGNEKTKTDIIEREISLKPGDLVNINLVRDSASRLIGLGIFAEVVPTLEPTSEEGVVDLRFQVTEAKTGHFAAGIGYNTADGLLGYLQVGDNNLFGMNYKLSLSVEVGKEAENYSLAFANPWIDSKRTSLETAIYSRSGQRHGYSQLRRGGNLAIGRPLTAQTRADLTLRLEEVRNSWVGEQPTGVTAGGALRSVGFRVMNDTRDNTVKATKGGVVKGSVELAGGMLGGDYSFNKYELQATRFLGLKPNHTVGLRLGYGTSTGELPPHERYEIGGSETVRGYNYREFVGDNMIYANAEYRYDINDTLQAVAFVDVGDAWTDGGLIKLSDLKTGFGAGVRIMTPIGVIRLDYGMGREGGNTYFSLGQTF
ncbi:MAG: BamA/TamA family outer membrane protein [Bacillota bacterium]